MNDAGNSALITGKKLHVNIYSPLKRAVLNFNNISQFYCFYCIFDQINAALVSIFKKKRLNLFKT